MQQRSCRSINEPWSGVKKFILDVNAIEILNADHPVAQVYFGASVA